MADSEKPMIKAFMPLTKGSNGEFLAVLSDNSIDRDEEMMGKELLVEWAKTGALNALVNHKNLMEDWVGGWTDFKLIERNGHTALVATPFFFSEKANPKAARVKAQVEEALEKGLTPGVSIGAIPKDDRVQKIDGKDYRVYTKAELVEASWTPVPSNRHAQAIRSVAKNFSDSVGLTVGSSTGTVTNSSKEVNSMTEKTFTQKEHDEALAKMKKEAEEQVAEAQAKAETAEAAKAEAEAKAEEAGKAAEADKSKLAEALKELTELKEKANLQAAPVVDAKQKSVAAKEADEPITLEKGLAMIIQTE